MHSKTDLIRLALAEDIGPGDITTDNLIPEDQIGTGTILAKESMVVAGLQVARTVFFQLDADVTINCMVADGDAVESGTVLMTLAGNMRALLTGERTALNFLQRLCGIATFVQSHVKQLGNARVRLVDTRKTTPGWRALEKYAVRVGGAANHRFGLYDGVLIKDNHIAACGGITAAVQRARGMASHLIKIEVETSDLEEVREALACNVDVIMLDNMDIEGIREAVAVINGQALVEVSGGISREDLPGLAQTGVDIISVGALTHSARAMDISMRILSPDA